MLRIVPAASRKGYRLGEIRMDEIPVTTSAAPIDEACLLQFRNELANFWWHPVESIALEKDPTIYLGHLSEGTGRIEEYVREGRQADCRLRLRLHPTYETMVRGRWIRGTSRLRDGASLLRSVVCGSGSLRAMARHRGHRAAPTRPRWRSFVGGQPAGRTSRHGASFATVALRSSRDEASLLTPALGRRLPTAFLSDPGQRVLIQIAEYIGILYIF